LSGAAKVQHERIFADPVMAAAPGKILLQLMKLPLRFQKRLRPDASFDFRRVDNRWSFAQDRVCVRLHRWGA